ncbi:MAG: hypothetical protein ABFR63_07580 [Thermodesulfobacteriota bacterium]
MGLDSFSACVQPGVKVVGLAMNIIALFPFWESYLFVVALKGRKVTAVDRNPSPSKTSLYSKRKMERQELLGERMKKKKHRMAGKKWPPFL